MSDRGENILAALLAVAVHLAVVAVLVVGVQLRRESPIIATNIIEGTLIDGSAFADEIETIKLEETPVEIPEDPPEPEVDDSAEREVELERRRLEEERQQQELAERKREQDEAERKRQEDLAEQLRQRDVAERERQVELAERKRLEEEARSKAEADAKLQAEEEARKQAALEQQRKRDAAEKKRREDDEARKRVEAEIARKEREAAMKQDELEQQMAAGIAAEERRTSAIDAGLLAVYMAKIRQKIQRYWRPPPFSEGAKCELRARQLRTGDVVSVDSVDCGGNAALERSLEAAVNKASPLPTPDDPSLFDPNLVLIVDPDS